MRASRSERLPSVFYHPSMMVIVDDCLSYCESLQFGMPPEQPVVTFNKPEQALDWLRPRNAQSLDNQPPISVLYDDVSFSLARRRVEMHFPWIHRQVRRADRFMHPAVVVVDYAMPQMSGLEFCAAIADLPCRTILLTGAADERIAVDGFNNGLIDRYIKKSDPNVLDVLRREASVLQEAYFRELSGTMHDLLSRHSFSFLSDPATMDVLGELMARYRFVEYCLYPNPGGFLLLTASGDATLMVIETESGLLTHYESAGTYDAPLALLDGLRQARIVPFFWPGNGMYTPACRDWEQFCLPAQTYRGRETYRYALFSLPDELRLPYVHGFRRFKIDCDATGIKLPR